MHGALDLVVDGLAVHRLTRLVTEDTISEPFRDALWQKYPLTEHRYHAAFIPSCPHCSSVWAAFAVTLTHTRPLRFLRPVIYALALSDMTSLVADYAKKPGGWS